MKSKITKILVVIFVITIVFMSFKLVKVNKEDKIVDAKFLSELYAGNLSDTCKTLGDVYHTAIDGTYSRWGQRHVLSSNNSAIYCVEHDLKTPAGLAITGVKKTQDQLTDAELKALKAIYYGEANGYSLVQIEVVASHYYYGSPSSFYWYVGAQDLNDKIESYTLPKSAALIVWQTGKSGYQTLFQAIDDVTGSGKIRVKKSFDTTDSGDAQLYGAEYKIYSNSSCTLQVGSTLTTKTNGYTEYSEELSEGTYYVKETKAPIGCELDYNIYRFDVTIDTPETRTIESIDSVKKNDIRIIKKIGATGITEEQYLSGVEFTATLISDITKTYTSTTTNSNGVATFSNLPYGTYKISETKYPNTVLKADDWIVAVTGGDIETLRYTKVNTPKTITIQVNKTFKSTDPGNASLEGAVYTVYDESGTKVLDLTTTANGKTSKSVKLPSGTYYVQETKASPGCKLDTKRYTVTEDPATQTVGNIDRVVSSKEETNQMKIKINKSFKSENVGDASLEGAVYTIYNNNVEVTTVTIDKNGTGVSIELPVKMYTVKETKASNGCSLDPTIYTVEGKASTQSVVEYSVNSQEDVIVGNIDIIKNITASSNTIKRPLAGAKFTATLKSDISKKYVSSITDENGLASFSNLPYGTYVISETTVPIQALKSNDFEVVIPNSRTEPYEVIDEIKEIDIEVQKVLNTSTVSDAKVVNAKYGVYSSQNCSEDTKLDVITIGENGKGKSSKKFACLPNTKYYVREIESSQGCFMDTNTYEITCDPASQSVKSVTKSIRSTEIVKKNNIEIVKKLEGTHNTTEKPLAGARFTATLKSNNSQKYVSTITDENGYAVFTDVLYGEYTIEETTVPTQALKLESFDVMVSEDKTERGAYVYEKVDKSKRAVINLKKTLDILEPSDAKVVNARYGVYALPECNEESKVDEIVTNSQGYGRSHELLAQNYYIREIESSEGCLLDREVHEVVMDPSTQTQQLIEVSVASTEKVIKNNIEITKRLEATGNSLEQNLAGARFTATLKSNPTKKYVSTVTDENGYAVFTDVLYGEYIIEETEVPVVSLKIDNFEMAVVEDKTQRGAYTYTLVDKAKKIIIKLNKEDKETINLEQGDAKLDGAEYSIFKDEACTDKIESIFVSNHQAQSSALLAGVYYLKETKAPEGYLIDDTVYKIEMTADMISSQLEFTDVNITSKEQVKKGNIHIVKSTEGTNGATINNPAIGVELTLTLDSDKTKKYIINTDENGVADFLNIPYGHYTLAETKGIEGFKFMEELHFYLQDNNQEEYRIVVEEAIKSGLEIVKKDEETGKVITVPGTTYKIWDIKNQSYIKQKITSPVEVVIEEFVTNEEGKVILPLPLAYGDYELEEVRAPYGYVLLKERIPFSIKNDESGSVQVVTVNQSNIAQKGRITVEKKGEVFTSKNDEQSNYGILNKPIYTLEALSGVEYTITALEDIVTNDGTVRMTEGETRTFTTNENGIGTYEYLYLGKYKIKESKTVNGYLLNSEEKEFELTYQGQNIEVYDTSFKYTNKRQKAELSFKKIFEECKFSEIEDPYKNVKFGLYARDDLKNYLGNKIIEKNSLIEVIDVQADGMAKIKTDLPLGKYYVKELATDYSYKLNENEFDFEFVSSDDTTEVYTLSINNSEGIINEFDGGNFKLQKILSKNEKKNPIFKFISDVINNILDFFRGEDNTQNGGIQVENDVSLVGAKYQFYSKNDGENIPLTVKKENSPEEMAIYTTDEKGQIQIEGLPYGKYAYKEIKSPDGFVLDDTIYEFEIQKNAKEVIHKRENDPQYGQLEINKTDKITGKPIEDCSFRLREFITGKSVVEGKTDKDGVCNFKNIPVGKYVFEEFDAPEKYRIDTNSYEFEIKEDGQIVKSNVVNILKSGNVEISKVELVSGAIIPNCKFVIKDENKNIIREGITNENGICKFEELPLGKYMYQEIEAPDDYIIDTSDHEFEIENDFQTLKFEVTNELITGGFVIEKTDLVTGEVIPNCKFVIKNEKYGIEKEALTDENGICEFKTLPYGKYTYQEIEAPDQYRVDEKLYEFEIKNKDEVVKVEVTNKLKAGDIQISKLELLSRNVIPNCKFVVKDENEKIIREGITNDDGICKFEELPLGKYTYQEIEAPEGYIIDTEEHEFEIENDKQVLKFEVINELIRADVVIKKTDLSNSKLIPNCKFVIKDEKENIVREGITDQNGICEFKSLPYGKYTYQEVEAPKEYILDTRKHEFSITEKGKTLVFEVTNELKPSTGDINIMLYTSLTIISIIVVTFAVIKLKRYKGKCDT